jgi:carboxymethylenebutenolidase
MKRMPMKRMPWLGLGMMMMALAAPLGAQQWAQQRLARSPRHREFVRLRAAGRELTAFVAYPQAAGKRPVVVMVHEIFGLSPWAEEMADELAGAGYVTIVPDLLSGMGPKGGGTPSFPNQTAVIRAVSRLPAARIEADLNAAANWGLRQPAANGELFVAGFCWGGGQAFRFATERKGLRAAFVFYGVPPKPAAMARITAPVFGFYAGLDARISLTVPATRQEMAKLGKTYRAVVYPGAGHGFMRAGEQPDPTPGNAKARAAAWARLKRLLARYGG